MIMKNLIIVSLLFLIVSCKKNYQCHCNNFNTANNQTSSTDYTFKERSKDIAKTNCTKKGTTSINSNGEAVISNCQIQ